MNFFAWTSGYIWYVLGALSRQHAGKAIREWRRANESRAIYGDTIENTFEYALVILSARWHWFLCEFWDSLAGRI